jgi:hypothetical protein
MLLRWVSGGLSGVKKWERGLKIICPLSRRRRKLLEIDTFLLGYCSYWTVMVGLWM